MKKQIEIKTIEITSERGNFSAYHNGKYYLSGRWYFTPNGYWADWGTTGKCETYALDFDTFKESLKRAMEKQIKWDNFKTTQK